MDTFLASANESAAWTNLSKPANVASFGALADGAGALTNDGFGVLSYGAPALDVSIAPTWTGQHTWASGSITTSKPLAITQTWNAGGVTFNSLLVNITDTASAAASLLMDLQVGGSSKFKVSKAGNVTTPGSLAFGSSGGCKFSESGWLVTFAQDSGYLQFNNGGNLVANVTSQGLLVSGAYSLCGGLPNVENAFLNSPAAATWQLGKNAAGVTNQLLKGPDRITSDGVGGNLTIAGGKNRGANAGGSVIFQTSPSAGAGVTGTLTTRMSISGGGIINMAGLPTSSAGLTTGDLWNNSGVLNVVP